jgi:hypothetical protein
MQFSFVCIRKSDTAQVSRLQADSKPSAIRRSPDQNVDAPQFLHQAAEIAVLNAFKFVIQFERHAPAATNAKVFPLILTTFVLTVRFS